MKRWTAWIASLLALALIFGCSNAGSYVRDTYPLVDVQGKGKDVSKVYEVEGKDVPTTAKEIASKETPQEISKEDKDQMFLAYKDKLIQVEKDPQNEQNSLVEISTIEYARNHYDSSFLQGYLTATIIQSLFGGGWFSGGGGYGSYRGYTSLPRTSTGQVQSPAATPDVKKPGTSDRSGSFNTKPAAPDSSGSSKSTAPSTGGSSGSFNTNPSTGSGSSSARKSDGSTPTYKAPSKPNTSTRSGSFSRRR